MTCQAGFYRWYSSRIGVCDRPMTERAIKTDTRELVPITVHLRVPVGVNQWLIVGMGDVWKGDRLFRALVKAKHRERVAKPRGDDEHHDKTHDGSYPESTKREYRYKYLDPSWAPVIRLRLLVQCLFTTRRKRRFLSFSDRFD